MRVYLKLNNKSKDWQNGIKEKCYENVKAIFEVGGMNNSKEIIVQTGTKTDKVNSEVLNQIIVVMER